MSQTVRGRLRCRLAVVLLATGPVADETEGLRRALGSNEIGRLRPHVTLVAPVNVAEDAVDGVIAWVRSVCAGTGPLSLELGPPATFWPDNPVVYLAVDGSPKAMAALAKLAAGLGSGPLAPPPGRPQRPFVPHLTLNQHIAPEAIEPALRLLSAYRATTVFEVATVVRFDEAARRWLPVAEAPLDGPAVVGRGGREIELTTSGRLSPEEAAWSEAAWAEHARRQYGAESEPDRPFVVTARSGGALCGIAEGDVRGATCRLARLIVAADERGTGVGTQLLQAVEHLGRRVGCVRARLEAGAGTRAEQFYSGRGYEVVAGLAHWRGERDFVVMEKAL